MSPLIETYDPAQPADIDQSAQGDDRIRELKRALTERLNRVWPNWPNGDPLTWTAGIIPSAALTFSAGSVPALSLPAKSVTQALIALLAIGTPELIDLAVTAAKIANGAVGDVQLGNFPGTHVTDNTLPGAKLIDASIGSAKYALLSILAGALADGAVSTSKILDANVTNAKVLDTTLEVVKFSVAAKGLISVTKFVDVVVVLTTLGSRATVTQAPTAFAGVAQKDSVACAFPPEFIPLTDGSQRKLLAIDAYADVNQITLVLRNNNDGPLDFPASTIRCFVTKTATAWGL